MQTYHSGIDCHEPKHEKNTLCVRFKSKLTILLYIDMNLNRKRIHLCYIQNQTHHSVIDCGVRK